MCYLHYDSFPKIRFEISEYLAYSITIYHNILNHSPCIMIHIILPDSWQYRALKCYVILFYRLKTSNCCLENFFVFLKCLWAGSNCLVGCIQPDGVSQACIRPNFWRFNKFKVNLFLSRQINSLFPQW